MSSSSFFASKTSRPTSLSSVSNSRSASSTSSAPPNPPSTRLYVGNLHYTVDEYALIKIFSRFGKIAKLDFLYHKVGVMKGKPRGFCFVEFGNLEDAKKSLAALHDKPLRGRNLIVTYASANQADPTSTLRRPVQAAGKQTTLSLVKGQKAPQGAEAQIRALEAKLAEMKKGREALEGGGVDAADPSSSTKGEDSQLAVPPSSAGLPTKPSVL